MQQQTREKTESLILTKYNEALDQLGQKDTQEQGYQKLLEIQKDALLDEKEFVSIKYGVHFSLAQYYIERTSQQQQITKDLIIQLNNCLYHLSKSLEIHENWETYRSMGFVARKLGFLPKSLNYLILALQQCNQALFHSPLIYQICIITFLLNDYDQFNYFSNQLQNYEEETINAMRMALKGQINDQIIKKLQTFIDEQKDVQKKLELNPFHEREPILINQLYQISFSINKYNILPFFKSVRQQLKYFETGKKKKGQQQVQQDEVLEQGIANTKINIKIQKKEPQNKQLKLIKSESKSKSKRNIIQKDFRKQEELLVKDQHQPTQIDELIQQKEKIKYHLDQIKNSIYQNYLNLFHQIFQFEEQRQADQFLSSADKYQLMQIDNQESLCPIATYLMEQIDTLNENKDQFLTLIHLFSWMIQLFYKHTFYLYDDGNVYGPFEQILKRTTESKSSVIIRTFTKSLVWYYRQTNLITDDPFSILTTLELIFAEYLVVKKQEEACLKQQQKVKLQKKLQDLMMLINELKFEVQYRIPRSKLAEFLKDQINHERHYLIRYYHMLALIYSEQPFFYSEVVLHSLKELDKLLRGNYPYLIPWLRVRIEEGFIARIEERCKNLFLKEQIQGDWFLNEGYVNLNAILENFEQRKKTIDFNENTEFSFYHVLDFIKKNDCSFDIIKRILGLQLLCFDQYFLKDPLKKITTKIDQFLKAPQFMEFLISKLNLINPNYFYEQNLIEIGIMCLKLAIIRLMIENEDSRLYFQGFLKIASYQKNSNIYVHVISLISQQEKPNFMIFSQDNWNEQVQSQLQELYNRLKALQIKQVLLKYFLFLLDNFSSFKLLQFYLLNRISFGSQLKHIYRLEKNSEMEEEIVFQNSSAESGCQEYSSYTNFNQISYPNMISLMPVFKRINLTQKEIAQNFIIHGIKYRLEKETLKQIKGQTIEINIMSEEVQEEIKKFAKAEIKSSYLITCKEIKEAAKQYFENYFDLQTMSKKIQEKDLEFLSVFLPDIYKEISDSIVSKFLREQLLTTIKEISYFKCPTFISIKDRLLGYVKKQINDQGDMDVIQLNIYIKKEFLNQIFKKSEIKEKQCFCELQTCFERFQKIRFSGLLNIIAQAQIFTALKSINYSESFLLTDKSIETMCFAITLDPSQIFLWKSLYNVYYDLASSYFLHQVFQIVMIDKPNTDQKMWFLSQKRIASIIEHVANKTSRRDEVREILELSFGMNLLKLFERKWVYKDPYVQADNKRIENAYQKIIFIINSLEQESRNQVIPNNLDDLGEFSFRRSILIEKYVNRTIKTINYNHLISHIRNLNQLIKLCDQIEKSPLPHYFEGKGYNQDLELEKYISIYKFILRFLFIFKMSKSNFETTENLKNLKLTALNHLYLFLSELEKTEKDIFGNNSIHLDFGGMCNKAWNNIPFKKILQFKQILLKTATMHLQVDENENNIFEIVKNLLGNIQQKFSQFCSKGAKKQKYRRSLAIATYYLAHFQYYLLEKKNDALQTLSEICVTSSPELVQIYKAYDKQQLEKDSVMAKFVNHDSVYLYEKQRVLNLYSHLLYETNLGDNLNTLVRKLSKVMVVTEKNEVTWINRGFGFCLINASTKLLNVECDENMRSQIAATFGIHCRKNRFQWKFLNNYKDLIEKINQFFIIYYLKQNPDTNSNDDQILEKACQFIEGQAKKKTKKV